MWADRAKQTNENLKKWILMGVSEFRPNATVEYSG